MTKTEAISYIQDNYKELFDKNENLNMLAVVKSNDDSYSYDIEANIDVQDSIINEYKSLKAIKNKSIVQTQKYYDFIKSGVLGNIMDDKRDDEIVPLTFTTGSQFKPISSYEVVNTNDMIRNRISESKGKLGLILNHNGKKYILSNKHVIGRKNVAYGDIVEKLITDHNNEDKWIPIAKYIDGDIDSFSDYAIAECYPDFSNLNEELKLPLKVLLDNKVNDTTKVSIGNKKNISVYSTFAYFKVSDDYLYKKSKILKNQILLNKVFVGGNSGSIAIDKNSKKLVGLLFASNSRYSALNDIDYVFQKITDRNVHININELTIFNQF